MRSFSYIMEKARYAMRMVTQRDGYLFKRIRTLANRMLRQAYYHFTTHKGDKVMEEEWDHLIIVDACRYDTFKKVNWLKGKLEKRVSVGSSTDEWLERNFTTYHDDIVYVTGNPKIEIAKMQQKETFRHVDHVWKYDWDERKDVMLPEPITRAALRNHSFFPTKRLIVHYIQPHWPFIGGYHTALAEGYDGTQLDINRRICDDIRFGKVPLEITHAAYEENLKASLREVEKLIKKLTGRIIITSDHGDSFGEEGLWFHNRGLFTTTLTEVPWLIIVK